MNAVNDNTGTPVARGLSIVILIAMVVMVFCVILLVVFGVILMTDNSISADLMAKLEESGTNMKTHLSSMALLGSALIGAMWFFVLNILRKIVKTLLDGDPFVPENISRLRLMWIVIALAEVLRIVTMNLSTIGEVTLDLRPGTWFVVFVVAALAEVFRHGAELRRDAELTI
ncbi:MAG: DUF2975 domain-containing protein [Hellea sp.]